MPNALKIGRSRDAWQLVKDSAGTVWLTKAGVAVPYGIRSIPVPVSTTGGAPFPDGTALSNALAAIGATAVQQSGIIQSVDAGAIMQGASKVGIPTSQTPGTTDPTYGQQQSSSEAVSVGLAITSPLDFLKFIAWIFHPRNLLRAVEFLVGIALIVFGFHAAMQARGERIEGFSTSEGAITRSGLGRVATELGRAARQGGSPQRPRSAPHRTRQRALQQRYKREEDLQRRRAKSPRPKKK